MTYEFDGKKYKQASSHQKEWGSSIISQLSMQGNEHILDLGCGDGVLTAQLAELVPNGSVLGIDASEGMIKEASRISMDNLSFEQADINSLVLEDNYDLIFSNAALHWVKNHDGLLKEVFAALKSNGMARFNFASDGNCANFFTVVKQEMTHPKYQSYFRDFVWPWYMPTVEEYKEVASTLSAQNIKVWEENADRYFPDSKAIADWVEQPSLIPFLSCIDDEKVKLDFKTTVINKVVEKTIQNDGTCFETFRRINVILVKT